ncbi:hypothetical protein A2U01_0020450, partial [Trifolium medium]|nr:hypothetical protein [Trifolium medium]
MGASERVVLEDKWRKVQIVEMMEVFVNRAQLIKDQASL